MRVLVAKGEEKWAMAVNDGNKCYHTTKSTGEAQRRRWLRVPAAAATVRGCKRLPCQAVNGAAAAVLKVPNY
jgi:hypothetical protein